MSSMRKNTPTSDFLARAASVQPQVRFDHLFFFFSENDNVEGVYDFSASTFLIVSVSTKCGGNMCNRLIVGEVYILYELWLQGSHLPDSSSQNVDT